MKFVTQPFMDTDETSSDECESVEESHAPNLVKGVVNATQLMRYSVEELTEKLAGEGVVKVERVMRNVEGVSTPTPTLFITFDREELPSSLRAGWFVLKVSPFITYPRRCYHCHRFGHISQNCRRAKRGLPALCVKCGRKEHDQSVSCVAKCVNCGEPHAASYKKCSKNVLKFRNPSTANQNLVNQSSDSDVTDLIVSIMCA